jgi:tRNA(Ile)-lysidine synthase
MKKGRVDWPGAALRTAAQIPRGRLHPSVIEWADSHPGGEPWAVALSGGADSVALLLLLWAHFPSRRGRLVALHFNHRLRGAESDADARFCAALCAGLGVALVSGRRKGRAGALTEAQAREARFAFMERAMARRGARALWLGHQQDDVAETILMRLSRGSGAAGLAAPRPVHGFRAAGRGRARRFHVRPLLGLKKAEISRALRRAGAPWREDSSNAAGVHFRNRIRLEVVPRWVRASARDALSGAALSRELLEEDDSALESWVDALKPLGPGRWLNVLRLAGLPRAVARRALHRWLALQPKAGELSRQGFDALLRAVERGGRFRHSLGNHGFAVIRAGRLRFEPLRRRPRTH